MSGQEDDSSEIFASHACMWRRSQLMSSHREDVVHVTVSIIPTLHFISMLERMSRSAEHQSRSRRLACSGKSILQDVSARLRSWSGRPTLITWPESSLQEGISFMFDFSSFLVVKILFSMEED